MAKKIRDSRDKRDEEDINKPLFQDMFGIVDEVLSREVKKFSNNSAHIIVPKKHIGKKAVITIQKKTEEAKV